MTDLACVILSYFASNLSTCLSTYPMAFLPNDQSIYNEDANQWSWTPEVGVEREVVGPFRSIEVMTGW